MQNNDIQEIYIIYTQRKKKGIRIMNILFINQNLNKNST